MTTIFIRTLIVYFSLTLVMRLMGKRQIGEMEVSDLITTLLISEIASLPVTNLDIPLSYALIPMVALLFLEVGSSVLLTRFPKIKGILSSRPTVLMQNGVLNQRALLGARMTPEELMGEIRRNGLSGFSDVKDAILENNGKVTLVPYAKVQPPTAEDLSVPVKDQNLMHIVFFQNHINRQGLSVIGKDESWLLRELDRRGLSRERLFCVSADSAGELHYIIKEEKR